jgi:hypothetical protein
VTRAGNGWPLERDLRDQRDGGSHIQACSRPSEEQANACTTNTLPHTPRSASHAQKGPQDSCPAGLVVSMVGEDGFEPPTYWSQTSRANQAALHPENQSCESIPYPPVQPMQRRLGEYRANSPHIGTPDAFPYVLGTNRTPCPPWAGRMASKTSPTETSTSRRATWVRVSSSKSPSS